MTCTKLCIIVLYGCAFHGVLCVNRSYDTVDVVRLDERTYKYLYTEGKPPCLCNYALYSWAQAYFPIRDTGPHWRHWPR